jgi:hypothetical protein
MDRSIDNVMIEKNDATAAPGLARNAFLVGSLLKTDWTVIPGFRRGSRSDRDAQPGLAFSAGFYRG